MATTIEYSFVILGAPVGQGNLQPVPLRKGTTPDGRPVWDWSRPKLMHRNEKELKPWRQEVAATAIAARETFGHGIIDRDIAVQLQVVFYYLRPQSLHRSITRHTKRDDIDKVLRALGDALTGVAWVDDAQLDEVHAYKRYAAGALDPLGSRGTPRTVITVKAQEAARPKDAPLFDEPAAVAAVARKDTRRVDPGF